ncbi:MAG: hypothetical protein GXP04_03845, partial [Alphaproteobacteria bacterium]|nr:hypothetical protein [Alphaproteobacteria bacterium]
GIFMNDENTNKLKRFAPALVGLALVFYGTLVVIVNRCNRAVSIEMQSVDAAGTLNSDVLTITTWNIGYGGLGAESDFIADGGEHLLPPSRSVVDKNIAGINRELKALTAGVFIMQEVAGPSFLTRGGDTLTNVNSALDGADNAFSADFTVRHLPYPYAPTHGLFSSVKFAGATREVVALPLEAGYLMGVAKRLYHLHVVRIAFPGGEWTIINLHLSAFDDSANVRKQQLRAVFDFAEEEFSKGQFVVIGGDWNLEFTRPARATTTEDKDLFWIHPFPMVALGDEWRIAVDDTTPSVRTNERPYKRGENFTTVIDGFVVSPNVEIESVATHDTDFQYTDHHSVTAVLKASVE